MRKIKTAKRTSIIDGSGIRHIFESAMNVKNPIDLSLGQPDFHAPREAVKAVCSAITSNLDKYSSNQGLIETRTAISNNLREFCNINAVPEDILITSGTTAGIFLSLSVLLDPGDEVIIPDPYFVVYKQITQFLQANPVFIDTYPSFHLSAKSVEAAVTPKTRAIIINNPCNPTGLITPKSEISKICRFAQQQGIAVISDEVYRLFNYTSNIPFSPGSEFNNVITLSGISKSGGAPGWRIGWVHAPNNIVQEMLKIQQTTFVCSPIPFQLAAISILEHDAQSRGLIEDYKKKAELITGLLEPHYEFQKPEGAFYLFPKIPLKFADANSFCTAAVKHNLLIVPGNIFSEKKSHFRISFATSESTLHKGAETLIRLVSS